MFINFTSRHLLFLYYVFSHSAAVFSLFSCIYRGDTCTLDCVLTTPGQVPVHHPACYCCTRENLRVLKATGVPGTPGGSAGAPDTPPLPHLFLQAGTRGVGSGQGAPRTGGSRFRAGWRWPPGRGGGCGRGEGGAAGAPAGHPGARRLRGPTSPPAPPRPAPPCVYVETKMAAAVTALPGRPRAVSL